MEQLVQTRSVKQDAVPSPLLAHMAFHLTGKRSRGGLDAISEVDLRPALFGGYRDLASLRYDFPLVLTQGVKDATAVQSLSGLFDDILKRSADGAEGERLRIHALRLEREIRLLTANGAGGLLSEIWGEAARRLSLQGDERLQDSLRRLREALDVDGEVLDCNAKTAPRLLQHLWQAVQDEKTLQFRAQADALTMRLSDILRAELARSQEGRSAESLSASFGSTHREAFDFAVMSRLLAEALPPASLSDARRRRIRWLISVLTSQRFFPSPHTGAEASDNVARYHFVFEDSREAIGAYRERLPEAIELAKALAMAKLEVEGEYIEARHDSFFADFGAGNLETAALDLFPDYLIHVRASDLRPAELGTLLEACCAGLRAKVLVETDDLLAPSPIAGGNPVFGGRNNQVAQMAMDLNAFYVLQSSVANLFRLRDSLFRGMALAGPSLFSIYVGAACNPDVPAYLIAAAATESRAFPTFIYDPSAGPDWAARLRLADNPQVERDWPVQTISCEDDAHQRVSNSLAFTLVDFIACDQRYAQHFARVPPTSGAGGMVSVSEFLGAETKELTDKVPYLLMVDRDNRLHKVLVTERLVQEARRCADMWRSLQELGGIHNSHAAKLLAHQQELWEQQHQQSTASDEVQAAPEVVPAAAAAMAVPPAPDAVSPARPSDDPYIETPRCTTCNECTQINDKMFAYDANKQAFIADPNAGTYRQLVEAAESCQVAIIHPGKPRNPNEPGLEELLKRAESFL